MADRIVVMRDGVVEQVGAPLELYDRPANRFVAGFIGSPAMNFIEGSVKMSDPPIFVTGGGASLPLGSGRAALAEGPALCGIRPEHMALVPADSPGAIAGTVGAVEPTGAEILVILHHGEGDLTAAFRERHAFRIGERIALKPDADRLHLFDAVTGKALH